MEAADAFWVALSVTHKNEDRHKEHEGLRPRETRICRTPSHSSLNGINVPGVTGYCSISGAGMSNTRRSSSTHQKGSSGSVRSMKIQII